MGDYVLYGYLYKGENYMIVLLFCAGFNKKQIVESWETGNIQYYKPSNNNYTGYTVYILYTEDWYINLYLYNKTQRLCVYGCVCMFITRTKVCISLKKQSAYFCVKLNAKKLLYKIYNWLSHFHVL